MVQCGAREGGEAEAVSALAAETVTVPGTVVQSVQRAIRVLRCFSNERPELGVTEISQALALHKSTVSRLLAVLRSEGLVMQMPDTGKYRLGPGVVDLAGVALATLDIVRAAEPEARQLLAETQETVSLVARSGMDSVVLNTLRGPQPVQVVVPLGQRRPLSASAGGRVLLGAERDHGGLGLDGSVPLIEERWDEVYEIAAPILDHQSSVRAALVISAPAYRVDDEGAAACARSLLAAARRISTQLGYSDMRR